MNEAALTVRVTAELARRLRIQRAVTGESTNVLVTRLLSEYLDGPGRVVLLSAAADHTEDQYAVALDKLA